MRKVNYEQFQKDVKKRARSLNVIHLQNPAGRSIRTKPRNPEELDLLMRLAMVRKEEALQSGEYEIITPRRWRIHDQREIEK